MADNYLERRAEEIREHAAAPHRTPSRPALDSLLLKNRSCRGFDPSVVVRYSQLEEIVAVNSRIASAGNRQRLRFRLLCSETEAGAAAVRKVLGLVRFGAALPELHLPFPGTEPGACLIACAPSQDRLTDIDLGISLQSMSLKAVEMGLNTLILCSFDAAQMQQALALPLLPLAVLAVGKSAEKIFLKPVPEGSGLSYYRKDGIHYVPKLRAEDLII